MPDICTLTVKNGDERHLIHLPVGTNLRRALLESGLSPYAAFTQKRNCGGRGLCATCGVWIDAPPAAVHWHDQLAERFGYPRLSCQIAVDHDMVVHLIPEKKIWGGRQ